MAEVTAALAALNVACNVIAVVDFTWTLLTEAREIYKAETGASGNVTFIGTITKDIEYHDKRLEASHADNMELQELVKESRRITARLLGALEKMKTGRRHSKWKSFRAALGEVWGKSDIKDLTEKVEILQRQIARHVQMSISQKGDVKTLESNVMRAVEASTSANRQNFEQLRQAILLDKADLLTEEVISGIQNSRQLLSATKQLAGFVEVTNANQAFLQSLHFSSRTTRYRNIEVAYSETFEWILHDNPPLDYRGSTVRFKEWLEASNGIYWISGKPGSGKSTLMKFLYNNEKTKKCLRAWAQNKPLVTANFYFWNAGSTLQKSQEGLLRSIVFEMLRQSQDLITVARSAVIAPSRFEQDDKAWELDELLSMYTAIVTCDMDRKFCLFIDGLDEFEEGRRTHRDLLNTLRHLKHSPNVKVCLSSRPWTEFDDEFRNDAGRLKLEELTRGDIERYVTTHFTKHPQFKVLATQNIAYSDFIQLVVDRAQGVFLWVYLVMRELLKGLTHHDSLNTLRRRLDGFPPDLEEFFKVLIKLVDPMYHKQMARYFFLAVTAKHPLPASFYSFMDDLEDNPVLTLEGNVRSMSDEEDDRRQDQLKRRLDGRTRGLLELHDSDGLSGIVSIWTGEVDFLHRTVRDFLRDYQNIQNLFTQHLSDESPSLTACKAILISNQTIPSKYTRNEVRQTFRNTQFDWRHMFLFAAIYLDTSDSETELEKLLVAAEETENTARSVLRLKPRSRYFLGMAAGIGCCSYLESKLKFAPLLVTPISEDVDDNDNDDDDDDDDDDDNPALFFALHLTKDNLSNVMSMRCISLLLNAGADPNERYVVELYRPAIEKTYNSVWCTFLDAVRGGHLVLEKRTLYELSSLLISHGADLAVSPNDRDTMSTVDILTPFLGRRMVLQLHEEFLQKQVAARKMVQEAQVAVQKKRKSRKLCCFF
ncbi:hypothetical protein TruAng_003450 [Truncatella angustata]|nr:hypothetical protein TruAng_003450 [Truncatella angustata]